ncbi:DNA-directed RNA polymerase core subunit RPC19 [Aspergillus brunneoviolaceus CBS 621.78]|uniref:DNA-directed RNA polymerase I and III 14 kDa polypeptide n=1 Tax=Aspergillus brunneoviolaceus CBS 621.78 TaxID=1450534 RepID=A0ACD1G152_9EURO|nr:DNA-directed RNA polymerase I and III 14 KDA polypeptide [Aspergillus brunneoviolaceus CBS 621.78]RAH42937.1 DNA-directed RNA polymerase I and III 14 KDA polypeptide [Aspergillus brunneoviolaceus CBS 621.78]
MPGSVDQENDQSMMDAAPEQQHEQEDVLELEDKRIVVLPGATETAASFQFDGEGHTLGNALRYAIMKNPRVEFCGYTIPHPSETKMNLRIQTYDTTTAVEALEKGLDTLMDLCDVVTDKFTVARDEFNASKVDRMES